jgi:hypothetical protein
MKSFMNTYLTLLTYSILCVPIFLYSYTEERAINNLANDFSECTAYFMLSAGGAKNSGNLELEEKLNLLVQHTFTMAKELSNDKTTQARVLLSIEDQKKEMENHYSNFSRLILKYNDFCIGLNNNPKQRLDYWMNKKD